MIYHDDVADNAISNSTYWHMSFHNVHISSAWLFSGGEPYDAINWIFLLDKHCIGHTETIHSKERISLKMS